MDQRRRPPRAIESELLLTATLCLLAAGAVMVFSASSARTLLSGQGSGLEFLVRYGVFAGLGIVAMLFVARMPLVGGEELGELLARDPAREGPGTRVVGVEEELHRLHRRLP